MPTRKLARRLGIAEVVKLEDIGFYTLSDARAHNASASSSLWRCELLITSRCSFQCVYCRRFNMPDINMVEAVHTINKWASQGLKNIRFSGGEPTLYKQLPVLCSHAKARGVERIAISTNGSAEQTIYKKLLNSGVNDFSISLDACCQETMNLMSGGMGYQWDKLIANIKYLSLRTYVTLGVVLTEDNIKQVQGIIDFGKQLGVSDIRIITAAQWKSTINIDAINEDMPILNYRLKNIRAGVPMRGLADGNVARCKLVLDDMCVVDKYHYPCIIYFRERGKPIGYFGKIGAVCKERRKWSQEHDIFNDSICQTQCLDVCRDYNIVAAQGAAGGGKDELANQNPQSKVQRM